MKNVQSKNLRLSDDARRVAWVLEEAGSENLLCILATLRAEVGDVQDIVARCIEAIVELLEKELARLVRHSSNGMEQSWPEENAIETNPERALRVFFEPELFSKPARIQNRDQIELHVDLSKRKLIYGAGASED